MGSARDDQASDGEHPQSQIGTQASDLRPQLGESRLASLGCNVIPMVGGLTDGVCHRCRFSHARRRPASSDADGSSSAW